MGLAKITVDPPPIAQLPPLEQKLPMDFSLTVPGGSTVSLGTSAGPGATECKMLVDYTLPSITLSMAPFGFIFCIVDAMLSIKAFAEAVPDALGPPPDPSKLTSALADLATKFTCILNAIPTLSVPLFVKDIIDLLLAMITCIIEALQSLQETIASINDALTDAPAGSALAANLQASLTTSQASVDAMTVQLKPMQGIFTMMNVLLSLIGQGPISFAQPAPGTDVGVLITTLQGLQITLQALRDALP